jgi:hypothetical protein
VQNNLLFDVYINSKKSFENENASFSLALNHSKAVSKCTAEHATSLKMISKTIQENEDKKLKYVKEKRHF